MKQNQRSSMAVTRVAAALGLAATLGIAFSEAGSTYRGYFDLRAGLLVFAAPVLVLLLFQKQPLRLREMFARMSRLRVQAPEALAGELSRNSASARGQYGFSHVAKFSESHADPLVRYAGGLYSARFGGDELARLLTQRIQAEDTEWQIVGAALGFLTKMAPYFGMLATVIGMIKLLENMSDFTRISGSMALAMQGTLYGLLSFTLLYSPLQRYVTGCRDESLKRNELIARWFVLLAEQADPAFIERDMGSLTFTMDEIAAPAANAVPVAARGLS